MNKQVCRKCWQEEINSMKKGDKKLLFDEGTRIEAFSNYPSEKAERWICCYAVKRINTSTTPSKDCPFYLEQILQQNEEDRQLIKFIKEEEKG